MLMFFLVMFTWKKSFENMSKHSIFVISRRIIKYIRDCKTMYIFFSREVRYTISLKRRFGIQRTTCLGEVRNKTMYKTYIVISVYSDLEVSNCIFVHA